MALGVIERARISLVECRDLLENHKHHKLLAGVVQRANVGLAEGVVGAGDGPNWHHYPITHHYPWC